jgi:serine/threonine protein kinase
VSEFNICVSGKRQSKFRKSLVDVKRIGYGSFGEIYSTRYRGIDFVVKEAFLQADERKKLESLKFGRKRSPGEIPKQSYPSEYALLQLTQSLLNNRISPNFIFVYNMALCDDCVVNGKSGSCYLTFMEPANFDLRVAVTNGLLTNVAEQLSSIQQIFMAVHAIHSEYGIIHRDIKMSNILVKRVPPGGSFQYNCSNTNDTFLVKNVGLLVMLSDFGVSKCIQPQHSKYREYGIRNAKFNPNTLLLEPIICKYSVSSGKRVPATRGRWMDGELIDNQPNIPVSLNDTFQFPAFEFFNDIQDVVRMFIGGKRTVQPGNHTRLPRLNASLSQRLTEGCYAVKFPYSKDSARFIIASQMAKQISTIPKTQTAVLESFEMK